MPDETLTSTPGLKSTESSERYRIQRGSVFTNEYHVVDTQKDVSTWFAIVGNEDDAKRVVRALKLLDRCFEEPGKQYEYK